jgi:hypothetical protein
MQMAAKDNNEKAVAFRQMASRGNVREAYSSHVGPGFCHHGEGGRLSKRCEGGLPISGESPSQFSTF